MTDLPSLLAQTAFLIGRTPVSYGWLLAAILLLGALAAFLGFSSVRAGRERALALAAEQAERARLTEERMSDVLQAQAEMQGRMAALADVFGSRQAELTKALGERLDGMSLRLGSSITEQTKATHDNLAKLQERLAVIDSAQANIQSLASNVMGLQAILQNKQTRGAFGQARMEAVVADGLPQGAYAFQATLSNGARPDCIIHMPNGQPPLVIDAKFPLEAWERLREAGGADQQTLAAREFRRDIEVHIKAIAEKYFIAGETHDTAFLFVPSESIFAEIHENHDMLVQKAHRARIVIVSPSLLMLSIQIVQSVLRDVRMREQAHLIQGEVIRLMEDVNRLDERVRKLQGHFGLVQKDVEEVLTSSAKITGRGRKIEALDFTGSEAEAAAKAAPKLTGSSGQLKLRVVDEG
ncbi:MAG: DNA recombination protein RmuC [Rhizobiaceae bacterium]|jgi:DNA recombination protein RmuC|nr:DNA recombination protein RmuC [Rhizobiaceae bacterium]